MKWPATLYRNGKASSTDRKRVDLTSVTSRSFLVNVLPNLRLKLTAPVVCGKLSFVIIRDRRCSLGAIR